MMLVASFFVLSHDDVRSGMSRNFLLLSILSY